MAIDPSAGLGAHRDADAFGGVIPCDAVARSEETLVAALGLEHHADGAVLSLLVLTRAPGLVEWDGAGGLEVSDDVGGTYEWEAVTRSFGLGQMATTIWITPAIPADARFLRVHIDEMSRVNPARGERGVARPLTGGPWHLSINLVPARTVADPPERPVLGTGDDHPSSVPARAHGMFTGLVPVGQVRLVEGNVIEVMGVERYWDRWILSLSALGPAAAEEAAPAIGRAVVEAWDDRGTRYRIQPIHGESGVAWTDCAFEATPALDEEATRIAVSVSDVPRGNDTGRRFAIAGPVVFGVRVGRG